MDPVAYFVFGVFILLILAAIIVPHLAKRNGAAES